MHQQSENIGQDDNDVISRSDPLGAESGYSQPAFFSFGLSDERLDFLLSLNETPLLRAFRHGVMLVMPLLLGAAIAILANNFPLDAYQKFMSGFFGSSWKEPGIALYNSTIGILAIATSITLSDCLIASHNKRRPDRAVLPILGSLTTLVCLFIMNAPIIDRGAMTIHWAGINGLFGALIISCAATSLFLRLCRLRALRLSFYSEGADPILPHMFDTILPSLCTMGVFVALHMILTAVGLVSLQQAFYTLIQGFFSDTSASFGLGALYTFLVDLLWFFGIHGADLLDPITHDVLIEGIDPKNIPADITIHSTHIFTKSLFEVFVFPGGSGATLGLLAAIFLRSRDFGTRRVAALSVVPGIFNINELLLFGLPIVLNPAFLLPFVLVPVLLLCITYLAVVTDLVPLPMYKVDWITPPLLNGFLATDSWKGTALQLVNLSVATCIYIPFVDLADRAKIFSRRRAFHKLVAVAKSHTRSPSGKYCTDRSGSVGALARSLVNDLANALKTGQSIQLYFQPRVNLAEHSIPSVEALLRWRHPFYGHLPPQLVLALAEDSGLTRDLDNLVLRFAFEQQDQWRKNGIVTALSINLSESQLQDKNFPELLSQFIASSGLPADAIICEVREGLALHKDGRYLPALKAIRATGTHLSIDDFGASYQALARLDEIPLNSLQVDSSLAFDVAVNPTHQNILRKIQERCMNKGIASSIEAVESRDQLEALLELNFSTFQGRHFSEPVNAEECAAFIRDFTSHRIGKGSA